MLRIGRLTDYAVVLLRHMAKQGDQVHTANGLSLACGVALPTVSKLLKLLTKGELTKSIRGANGGYMLARPPGAISLADIISVLEGYIALTDCDAPHDACQHVCDLRGHWGIINRAVLSALQSVSLADLVRPVSPAPEEYKIPLSTIGVRQHSES